jgi:bifunctional DNA primase/polymerase-like protein
MSPSSGAEIASEVAALTYLAHGFNVLPIRPKDKRPCVPWKQLQTRRVSRDDVRGWYRQYADAGVGIVCGRISGLVVVDGDPRNGAGLAALTTRLPATPVVETGGGGRHYYFCAPTDAPVRKVPGLVPGVDLQGEASYVVAPPTIHLSGAPYQWSPRLALSDIPLAPLPVVIRQLLALHATPMEGEGRRPIGADGPVLDLPGMLGRLAGVRRVAGGYVARCPAHDDREPSLSLGEGTDGRLLLFCFAGCTFETILRATRPREGID